MKCQSKNLKTMTQTATTSCSNSRLRVLMLANGNANQTTGRLFITLEKHLSVRHQTNLLLRQFPRGVFRKLLVMMRTEIESCRRVARSDVLIVHSSLSLSFITILFAKLMSRRIIAFVWDFYPASSRYSGNIRNPLLLLLGEETERLAYRMCERIFVPSADFARFPALKGIHGIEVVPHWPCDPLLTPIERRPKDGVFRIVFAGQIDVIRGLPRSIERLARSRFGPVWIDIYSASPPNQEFDQVVERCPNLGLAHHGFVQPDELSRRMHNSLFGLVSLDASFSLPAFPTKILAYIAAGIPVIYDGPPMPALERTLRNTGVGLSMADLVTLDDAALDAFLADFPAARDAFVASIDPCWDRIENSLCPPTAFD